MKFDPRIHDDRCRDFWLEAGAPEDSADAFAWISGWEPPNERCVLTPILETEVAEPDAPAAPAEPPPTPLEAPADKETEEEIRKRARKPPAGGTCIRCGEPKPINRLKMCYPCWVKFENEKTGWKEGQPHPKGCGCDTDCIIDRPAN